jgi:hypothetical protein
MTDIAGEVLARPSVSELVEAVGDEIARILASAQRGVSLAPISTVVPREDAPSVMVVSDATGRPRGVLMCSAPAAPDMVHRSTSRARRATEVLREQEAWRVLLPITEGRIRGLSYAVMPHCAPLSSRRVVWWAQRALLKPGVLDWLANVTSSTASKASPEEVDRLFRLPLERLASMPTLGASTRSAATRALDGLGRSSPLSVVLMHGDLWKGNLMVRHAGDCDPPRRWPQRFTVIDWPGSSTRGHPIYDLVRLSVSLRLGPSAMAREVDRHCALLGGDREQAMTYLLAAVGNIALHLEQFPLANLVRMADTCCAALMRSLMTTPKGKFNAG